MNLITLTVGQMQTNCYLLSDKSQNTIIIDPGDEPDYILDIISSQKLNPTHIFLTHGHFDHCLASLDLFLVFNLPIYLHPNDQFLHQRIPQTLKHFQGRSILPLPKTTNFPQLPITIDNIPIIIHHTPGHTPGSVCFEYQNHLFTGDSFIPKEKTDLSHRYSDPKDWHKSKASISKQLSSLQIHSGHGESSFGYSL